MTNTVVIYHHPCHDGFGACFVAHLFDMTRSEMDRVNNPYEFLGMQPSEPCSDLSNDLSDKHVIMVDISWPRKDIERIQKHAASLLILDHHKTAQEELKGVEGAIFDMNKSGVMLAWAYWFPDQPMPKFLRYIGLRDLWRHKEDPEAMAFSAAFDPPFSFAAYREYLDEGKVVETIQRGKYLLEFQEHQLAQLACKATEHVLRLPAAGEGVDGSQKVQEYRVRLINVGWPFTSYLGDFLTREPEHQHKVALMWTKSAGYDFQVSARSHSLYGPDVTPIAKHFGGGGHAHAAGFRLTNLPENFLTTQ